MIDVSRLDPEGQEWLAQRPPSVRELFLRYPPGAYLMSDDAPYGITGPGTLVTVIGYNNDLTVAVGVLKSTPAADAHIQMLSKQHGKDFTTAKGFAANVNPQYMLLVEVSPKLKDAYKTDA